MTRFPAVVFALLFPLAAFGQNFDAPPTVKPSKEQRWDIEGGIRDLKGEIATHRRKLQRLKVTHEADLDDLQVFVEAAERILRHEEFYQKEYIDWTIEALDRGMKRARESITTGAPSWLAVTGRSDIRGYRSYVDGSVQPYAVTIPADYGKDPKKKWRLDVVLHGRNTRLTEVSFMHQFNGSKSVPKTQDYIQIDVYGRGNNAYRWAGEADVHEAIADFLWADSRLSEEGLVDQRRIVLRGFSMGGAGTWHIGLHNPDRWCVLGPGAGFTNTRGYIKNLPEKLPPYQEACLHIYDAVDYAENVFDVPVVAYSGDKDPQMQAAVNIENRLKGTPFKITHLVAPGLEHRFPPEWQAKAETE